MGDVENNSNFKQKLNSQVTLSKNKLYLRSYYIVGYILHVKELFALFEGDPEHKPSHSLEMQNVNFKGV